MNFIEILTIFYFGTKLPPFVTLLGSKLLNIDLKENWTVKVLNLLPSCLEKYTNQYKISFIEAPYIELVPTVTHIVLDSTY